MTYTEIKEKGEKTYYYRVKSIRKGEKVNKKRIYLGVNLKKHELKEKEQEADKKLLNVKEKTKQKQEKAEKPIISKEQSESSVLQSPKKLEITNKFQKKQISPDSKGITTKKQENNYRPQADILHVGSALARDLGLRA